MTSLDSYVTLGRTGLRVSPMALGGMLFDDPSWGSDRATALRLLDRFVAEGGNFLDTANGYAEGRSEETIGEFIAGRPGIRDRLVIATKFAVNRWFPGDPNGGGAGRKAIVQQVDASLARLGTDYIDLYWQHHFDPHTPVEETIATLQDLVVDGRIRYFGISDAPAWAIARMGTIAELRGWSRVAAIQLEYSLLERTSEGELFGVARELGAGVVPYSPLSGGILSGKYSRENPVPEGSGRASWPASQAKLTDATYELLDALGAAAEARGTSVAAIALAWVARRPEVTSILIGARDESQYESNVAALSLDLTEEEVARLDQLTTPKLGFPFDFLRDIAVDVQQNGATINGVPSKKYVKGG